MSLLGIAVIMFIKGIWHFGSVFGISGTHIVRFVIVQVYEVLHNVLYGIIN